MTEGYEGHDAWHEKSGEKLEQARDCKDKVKKALKDLEQKHADKLAAIAEERARQERLAAARAARAKREQERKVREEYKRKQAEALKYQQDLVKAKNKGEMQALKQATADFIAARREENLRSLKSKRMFDMSKAQSELQNAYLACQRQHRNWFVAVKTCEMRLEAREKRPASELFVDQVQTSLEKELSTLNDARAVLKGLVDDGQKLSAEMSEVVKLIVTGQSRENVCGRSTQFQKSTSAPTLPAIGDGPPPGQNSLVQSMGRLFATGNPSQEELLDKGREQVLRADDLTSECMGVLGNCQRNCKKIMAHTNAIFDQRKAEVDALRKVLEQEKTDAAGSIKDAAHRITMMKMKASHHNPTEEELDEIRAAEAMLEELKEAKLQLDEDWRSKHAAFKIDLFCRNLTPKVAATYFKQPGGSPTATQAMAMAQSDFQRSFCEDDSDQTKALHNP